jgi:ParB family chromosome partitioning protein
VTRRSGLGRGLDALLPAAGPRTEATSGKLREVAVDAIEPNPNQPRQSFEDDALRELADSVVALGILQPLLVRALTDEHYQLVAGERRWRAARQAGLERVPVLVVDTDEKGSLERALVENIHRKDLNPIEEAMAYRQLIDEGGLTQEELGERIGRNRVTITNALRLLELPVDIQQMLTEGRFTSAHGRMLLGLQGSAFQSRLAKRVSQEGLSVRETEELMRKYQVLSSAGRGPGGRPARPPQAVEAQRVLAEHLQTRVRVEMGKRKGRIVLDFVSLDELERLLDVMTGKTSGASATVVSPH